MVSFLILETLAGIGYACTPTVEIAVVAAEVRPVCQNIFVEPWVKVTVLCSEFENTTNCWHVIEVHEDERVPVVAPEINAPVKVRSSAPIVTVV